MGLRRGDHSPRTATAPDDTEAREGQPGAMALKGGKGTLWYFTITLDL